MNDDEATFKYLGESDVLTASRDKAVENKNFVKPALDSYNFRDHCFGKWEINKCVNVTVTYDFTITNTYTIPQKIFYDDRKSQKLQVTVKNSKDADVFNNYGSLLEENHNKTIGVKKIHRLGDVDPKKQTFTINTCDEDGMNYAAFRIKMTLGIFNDHGNNGNLANRCKSIVGTCIL